MLARIEQASLVRRQALDDPFGSEADTSIKVSALSQSTPCNICQLPTAITHPPRRRRPEIPPQVMVRTHGDASAGPDVVLAAGAESDAADVLPPSRSVRWPLDCSQTVPSSAIETPLRAGSRWRQRSTDGTLHPASAGPATGGRAARPHHPATMSVISLPRSTRLGCPPGCSAYTAKPFE